MDYLIGMKVVLFLLLFAVAVESSLQSDSAFKSYAVEANNAGGTRWAVLIAGSNGYDNYRHQADVCHAYHILKKGGLRDENIVVFMYDDIAYNEENPYPGVIMNHPQGENVYPGVPKDYTGEAATPDNILAAIIGDQKSVTGGTGKVVKSGPSDHVFIFFSGHGGAGVLATPDDDLLFADDIIDALKTKHSLGAYKSLVFYLESCESGSIFDGLLPVDINIYATTAARPDEDSYATYFDSDLNTYVGDLYSVSWMEDSQKADRKKEELEQQYRVVKNRTVSAGSVGSHPMQYGDVSLSKEFLFIYMGADANSTSKYAKLAPVTVPLSSVAQRDTDILFLKKKRRKAPKGSQEKEEAQKKLDKAISHRYHVDNSMKAIGNLLFGVENGAKMLTDIRPTGHPLVDDWDCLKKMVGIYKAHCGPLATYWMKFMRGFANICNARVRKEQMVKASAQACS